MSGELQIVFVYDTKCCTREEDDPKDAILYFHPACIPEERRIAICGQLMGMAHFLIALFSAPKILTLENGKFALRELENRYVLVLGCSSVTPDWLLEKQTDILYELTRFFHKDIQNILNSVNGDRSLLLTKLSGMMDHYLPVSQQHGDLFALNFGILPILSLPKSANNIFLNASLILQTCSLQPGVLGGIIMYQNKLIAAHVTEEIARKLAFIQPYQLPPAECVQPSFSLPSGVQMVAVYLTGQEVIDLRKSAKEFQNPSEVQYRKNPQHSSMSSRIDSITEEESLEASSSSPSYSETPESTPKAKSTNETVSLIAKTSDDKPLAKMELNTECNPNMLPKPSSPMLRNSKIVTKPADEVGAPESKKNAKVPVVLYSHSHSHCQNSSALTGKLRECKSLDGLVLSEKPPTEDDMKQGDLSQEEKKGFSKSLADPLFPYIRCDGHSVSMSLMLEMSSLNDTSQNDSFEEQNEEENVESPCEHEILLEDNNNKGESYDCETAHSLDASSQNSKECSSDQDCKDGKVEEDGRPVSGVRRPGNLPLLGESASKAGIASRKWHQYDEILSPVVDTSISNEDSIERRLSIDEIESSRVRMINSFRRMSGGNSGGSNRSHKPNETSQDEDAKGKKNCVKSDLDNQLEKCCLLIYNDGAMRLLLILELSSSNDITLVNKLWEYGSSSLSDLEYSVNSIDEQSLNCSTGQNDHYCFLHFEPIWRSMSHGGRNHSMDFEVVQQMHQDFFKCRDICELIIRGQDHVVYGYQCVGSEVFYQQSANTQPGLPMPSDLMGKVPSKARRRLERDHNLLLL